MSFRSTMFPAPISRRVLMGALASSASACGDYVPDVKFRCRLSILWRCGATAGTSEAVSEHRWRYARKAAFQYTGPFHSTHNGEAVILELGGSRGDIFALRHPPGGQAYAGRYESAQTPIAALNGFASYNELTEKAGAFDALWKLIAGMPSLAGRHTLPAEQYPVFVRFSDPSDPTSIEELSLSNLVARTGETVTIDEVALEITEKPVTRVIQTKLMWLSTAKGPLDDGPGMSVAGPLAGRVGHSALFS